MTGASSLDENNTGYNIKLVKHEYETLTTLQQLEKVHQPLSLLLSETLYTKCLDLQRLCFVAKLLCCFALDYADVRVIVCVPCSST